MVSSLFSNDLNFSAYAIFSKRKNQINLPIPITAFQKKIRKRDCWDFILGPDFCTYVYDCQITSFALQNHTLYE